MANYHNVVIIRSRPNILDLDGSKCKNDDILKVKENTNQLQLHYVSSKAFQERSPTSEKVSSMYLGWFTSFVRKHI